MTIALDTTGSWAGITSATSFTLDISYAANGAVVIAWVTINVQNATITLSGWNAGPTASTASTMTGALFWRVKQSGDTTFVGSVPSGKGAAAWASYTGVDSSAPYETATNSNIAVKGTSGTNIPTPSITESGGDSWALGFFAHRTSTSGNRPMNIAAPTGMTERVDQNNNDAASGPWTVAQISDTGAAVAAGAHSYTAVANFAETYSLGGLIYLTLAGGGAVNATFSATTVGTATASTTGTGSLIGTSGAAVFTTNLGSADADGVTSEWVTSGTVTPGPSVEGTLVTTYRVEVEDADENFVGVLGRVREGSLSWDAYASVKSGGSLTVYDEGIDVDWLNARLRVVRAQRWEGTGQDFEEHAIGVYLCATPTADWTGTGRSWKVEVADKLSILDTDVPMDSTGLRAATYVAAAGANVVDTVKTLITDAGETVEAILPNPKTLGTSIVFEQGDSRLKIINAILKAGGFYSLFCDGEGQYRVEPYEQPTDRVPVYDWDTPFSKGDSSLMAPEWQHEEDIYDIPNRYVVWTQGTDTVAALTSTAINIDPHSEFSYQNRGDRWITRTETGVQAADQTALDLYARQQLSAASSVSSWVHLDHLWLPELQINHVVRFTNPDADLDQLCSIIKIEIPLNSTGLCKSSLLDVGPYIDLELP